jgi:hypothetical protein
MHPSPVKVSHLIRKPTSMRYNQRLCLHIKVFKNLVEHCLTAFTIQRWA